MYYQSIWQKMYFFHFYWCRFHLSNISFKSSSVQHKLKGRLKTNQCARYTSKIVDIYNNLNHFDLLINYLFVNLKSQAIAAEISTRDFPSCWGEVISRACSGFQVKLKRDSPYTIRPYNFHPYFKFILMKWL